MKLQKAIVLLTTMALTSVPIQQIVFATESETSITQALSQSSLFENSEYGIAVKIAKVDAKDIAKAEIELVKDKQVIKSLLKRIPNTLTEADFDLLLVKLTDNTGNPLVNVPSEISVKSSSLRGSLQKVLFLAEDGEYKTLSFEELSDESISFVTTKTNEFALVYKKSEIAKKLDKQEKLSEIVAFSHEDSDEKLSEIVSISSEQSSKSDKVVAISDETTKQQQKPELPKLDLDTNVNERPKEEPKKEEPKKEEPTPPVVEPQPEVPVLPPVVEPQPEVPTEPEVEEPVTEVGDGVIHEGLPYYDLLADDDGDGFTNGSELMFNTDPSNPESVPPLPNTEYERGAFFLNREAAKLFAEQHIEGKDRTYTVIEKTDEKGRTYFDILFSSIFVTDNGNETTEPVPAPQPEDLTNNTNESSTINSVSNDVQSADMLDMNEEPVIDGSESSSSAESEVVSSSTIEELTTEESGIDSIDTPTVPSAPEENS